MKNNSAYIKICDFPFQKNKEKNSSLSLVMEKGASLSCLTIDDDNVFLDLMVKQLKGSLKTQGNILLQSQPLHIHRGQSRPITSVSYNSPLFPQLDITDNINFPLHVQGRYSSQEIMMMQQEIQALLGLEKISHRYPEQIDVVMQFKVKLARAMVQKPVFVILNQITCSMTQEQADAIFIFLDRLKRSVGLNYLYLTTNHHIAFMASPRTAIFNKGSLCQVGTTTTVMDKPVNADIAQFLTKCNRLVANVQNIEDDIAQLYLPCGAHVEALAHEGLKPGQLATLCVPPQSISIINSQFGSLGDAGDGVLPATISSYFHLGDIILINLRLTDGTEVKIRRSPSLQKRPLNAGAHVYIAWQAQNGWAFPV